MSVNLQPKTQAINQWLEAANTALAEAGISSARLDAEIILAHTLRKPRTYLHSHNTDLIDRWSQEIADARLHLRLERTPIAYIIGHKEFYGRQFKVTPATLIPRPESETIITLLKQHLHKTDGKLIDVGTGSGILGITAKLELTQLAVTLADISRHALHIAKINANHHKADVAFLHSDLLEQYPFTADAILANLPYVDKQWERSLETEYEPAMALFASDGGLHLINRLLPQAASQLTSGGLIIIEADPRQQKAILDTALSLSFHHLETSGFVIALQKA